MIKHYFISTLRSLSRHRIFAGINVLGLSLSILAAIVILKHVAYEFSFDNFQKEADDLYRLSVSYTDLAGTYGEYPGISSEISPMLVSELPEILASVRVFPLQEAMRHTIVSSSADLGQVEFNIPGIMAVDPAAFDHFTFKIVSGSPEGFSPTLSSASINQSTAAKLFGTRDPVGEIIKFNGHTDFIVSSVFEDWPETSHFHPEMLVQMKFMEEVKVIRPYLHFIGGSSVYHYLKIDPKTDFTTLSQKLEAFVTEHKREQDHADTKLHLMSFEDIHLEASHLSQDMADVKNKTTLKLLLLLAALILMMAWFNYINLITSGSLQRSKEIAIRKIHGAGRFGLFSQLLMETLIIVILASGLALTIHQLFASRLSGIIGSGELTDLIGNLELFASLIGFMLIGMLCAASYPALILSSFKNPELLKGKLGASGKTAWLKKVLVVSQYVITIGLVFGTLTVINQIKYLKSIETNVELDKVLVLDGPGVRNPEFTSFRDGIRLLRDELKSISGIESVSTSNFVPGLKMDYTANLSNPAIHGSSPHYVNRIFADQDFTDVYGIRVTAGRFFEREASMDVDSRPLVVNESAALALGFDPPEGIVGKEVNYWNDPIKIIGVVEDFRMASPDMPIEPLFFFPTYDTKYFSIRLSDKQPADLIASIEAKWNKIYPGNPFSYFYAQMHFDRQFESFEQLERQLFLLALLSICIASLGLFALAFDTARQRIKEIGVRKVLGARVIAIIQLFLTGYLRLILLSALISTPIVYYLLKGWLNNYANQIQIGVDLLAYPTIGIIVLAVLVIGAQTFKVARMNPVDSLRYE